MLAINVKPLNMFYSTAAWRSQITAWNEPSKNSSSAGRTGSFRRVSKALNLAVSSSALCDRPRPTDSISGSILSICLPNYQTSQFPEITKPSRIICHGRHRFKQNVLAKTCIKANGSGIPYSIRDPGAVLNVPYNRALQSCAYHWWNGRR